MNWEKEIKEAQENGEFSAKAKKMAGEYRCCAVGERLYHLGFNPKYNKPLEKDFNVEGDPHWISYEGMARRLANDFYFEGVASGRNNNVNNAMHFYAEIQNLTLDDFGTIKYGDSPEEE